MISEKGISLDEIVVIDLFGEEFRFQSDNQVENPEQVAQYLKNILKKLKDCLKTRLWLKTRLQYCC